MPYPPSGGDGSKHSRLFAALIGVFSVGLFAAGAALPDQPTGDRVGAIEGESIAVAGPMSVEVVRGEVKTILRSGADVRVKSGQARIELVEGGQITICGPSHFSVLKSGGSLTLALDSGIIHAHIEHGPALTVYTAQIQAQLVSIGTGTQDVVTGFENPGTMCIRANRGAVRLEQQLTGQSVLVPQSGDVLLTNGQLDSMRAGTGHCGCELQIAKSSPPPPQKPRADSRAEEARNAPANVPPETPVSTGDKSSTSEEQPVYQVFMPPLRFDAGAQVQPEPDPRLIVLVRHVRVRPTLIFQGYVEGDPVTTAAVTPPAAALPTPSVEPPRTTSPGFSSVFDRVWSFLKRLWSRSS